MRLLLVCLVAAVCVGDVFRVRHKLSEPLLRLFLCGVGDVAEVRRNVGRKLPSSIIDGICGPRVGQQTKRTGGAGEVARQSGPGRSCGPGRSFQGLGTRPGFPGRRPQSAFVVSPTVRRLCIPKAFSESIDEDETGYVFGIGARIEPDDQAAIQCPTSTWAPPHQRYSAGHANRRLQSPPWWAAEPGRSGSVSH